MPKEFSLKCSVKGFGANWPLAQNSRRLACRWGDLIRAAITVGYSSWSDVWKYDEFSFFQAIHRVSILYSALAPDQGRCLIPTALFHSLDSSEKGAGTYHIGMAVAGLTASRLLNAGWLQHVDQFGGTFTPNVGRSERPDLIGRTVDGKWVIVEAKGHQRITAATKTRGKIQAQRIAKINGVPPDVAAVSIAGIYKHGLRAVLEDPAPEGDIELEFGEVQFLESYYRRLHAIVAASGEQDRIIVNDRQYDVTHLEPVNVVFGLLTSLSGTASRDPRRLVEPVSSAADTPTAFEDWRAADFPAGFVPAKRAIPSLGMDGTLVIVGARWQQLAAGLRA